MNSSDQIMREFYAIFNCSLDTQMKDDNLDDLYGESGKPSWICQHCGHEDTGKPMPKDRAKYYANPYEAKCPKCKGKSMMPSGF